MARTPNGTPPRKAPIPLTLVDQGGDEDAEDEVFIVYGEAGEDLAFEICEDLEIALEVRDSMLEDGFKVRLFQASEVEVVMEDDPAPGPGGSAA